MFGIGFSELAVIALVMIILIRPEDLPAFFRKLGRLYARARRAYGEAALMKDEFLREMDAAAADPADHRPADPPPRPSAADPGGE